MGFADLHIHSSHSKDGTCSVRGILKYVAEKTDLDVIAITDHDTVDGVREAMDLAGEYGIEVIPGCEVSTAEGHLLALFIQKPIQPRLSLIQTIELIGEQGGICIAAHPMARGTNSLQFPAIYKALLHPGANKIFLGIESFNGGLVYTRTNPYVEALALAVPIAQVGNSDAHILEAIGQGSTRFFGFTAQDLRESLERGWTRVRKGKGLGGLGVIRNYLPRYFLRKFGWVAHNYDPSSPITYARISKVSIPSPAPYMQ